MQKLNELQHWFGHAVIRRELDYDTLLETIVDNEQLSAEHRLGVYAEGYQLRLLECMRAEYACLDALLSRELFDRFALNYLNARPSTSYTLFDLGGEFALFLANTRPPVPEEDEQQIAMKMPEQLAQLERYRVMSIRGKGSERSEIPPLDATMLLFQPNYLFKRTDTSFVMETDFDFAPVIEAVENDQQPDFPEQKSQHLLIYRQGYRVKLMPLEPWKALFLQSCDGHYPWQAQQHLVSEQLQLSGGDLLSQLMTWLPQMVSMGVLELVQDKADDSAISDYNIDSLITA